MDDDFALALQLQAELEEDSFRSILQAELEEDRFRSSEDTFQNGNAAHEPKSLVDPYWELTDPNPDMRALFLQFNERFFWGRLAGVEVRWSPRMTLCAGLCCYEGRGGLCSIRLSVPLLKLRPRKDLIETLLHEMIHAYLFVTDNNKDHDGHGPEFHKHMYRINKETGTNISVYHNFHDEVDAYRQHWWRCDGPCRSRKPYFGYVKRSMNRAPSKNDTWWSEHQRTCGGTYTKVKEPENYGKKKDKKDKSVGEKNDKDSRQKTDKAKSSVKSMDIRIFGGEGKTLGNINRSDSVLPIKDNSVVSMVSGVHIKKPSATVSSIEDNQQNMTSKEKDTEFIGKTGILLPGSRTPDKNMGSKNKPVSQGGVAKFKDKKKKTFHLSDFSDSEDDELSIPMSSDSKHADGIRTNSEVDEKMAELQDFSDDPWSAWTSDSSFDDEIYNTGPPKSETKISESGDRSLCEEINSPKNNTDTKEDGDNSDVRAMLRKVWGQKQFGNSRGKKKFSKGISEKLIKPISIEEKSNKRLSLEEELKVNVKRRKVEDNSQNNNNSLIDSKGVVRKENPADKLKLTSPLAKFFKRLNDEKPSDSWQNAGSSTQQQSDVTKGHDSSLPDATDMSSCPVCNSSVLSSRINEHLDMCLTMKVL